MWKSRVSKGLGKVVASGDVSLDKALAECVHLCRVLPPAFCYLLRRRSDVLSGITATRNRAEISPSRRFTVCTKRSLMRSISKAIAKELSTTKEHPLFGQGSGSLRY